METLPDGGAPGDLETLPEWLRNVSSYGNTYCRLWWERPCTTITQNLGTPSSSRCIHPKAARALTTRESARIQSFPDRHVFFGTRSTKNEQVGNAVPPLLASALAAAISEHLLGPLCVQVPAESGHTPENKIVLAPYLGASQTGNHPGPESPRATGGSPMSRSRLVPREAITIRPYLEIEKIVERFFTGDDPRALMILGRPGIGKDEISRSTSSVIPDWLPIRRCRG